MALSIKFFIAAIFCCTVALSLADYYEDQSQSTWRTFILSNTIDPDVNVNYRNWTAQNWLELLNQRDVLIKEDCDKCDSLFKNDLNTFFIARKNEIIEAFSQNNEKLTDSEAAWSSKSFQTYTILNGSVFHCGGQYFYAQVDQQGLPTDLLAMSDIINRSDSGDFKVQINCRNIEESTAGSGTVSDELDGEDLDFSEDIPEDDAGDDIPEEYFSEDISDYDIDEDLPEHDFDVSENDKIEDIRDIEDDDVDTRVKRQLQLPETRQKIYKKFPVRQYPPLRKHPRKRLHIRSAEISENDFAEGNLEDEVTDEDFENDVPEDNWEDDVKQHSENGFAEENLEDLEPDQYEVSQSESIRVRRQIRIPPKKLTFPKSGEFNKYPFPDGFRNPFLRNDIVDENSEDDITDEITEDEYADQISENDFADEIDEENSDQDPSEDAEIEGDEGESDTTRAKRQIRIPRPTQTYRNPKTIKTVYYPPKTRHPKHYTRKIRSADIIRPPRAFPCMPPFVPCNPNSRNCKLVGPCRPPPYLPQTPRFPPIRF